MEFKIKNRKLNKEITFHKDGECIFIDAGRDGLGYLKYLGNDKKEFNKICLRWYRYYLNSIDYLKSEVELKWNKNRNPKTNYMGVGILNEKLIDIDDKINYMKRINKKYKEEGMKEVLRSEPNIDADLLRLAVRINKDRVYSNVDFKRNLKEKKHTLKELIKALSVK